MEVMTVINLKLVWASGARQRRRRRESKAEIERLRPGKSNRWIRNKNKRQKEIEEENGKS